MRVTSIRASVAVAAASALILAACTTDTSDDPTEGPDDDSGTEDGGETGAEAPPEPDDEYVTYEVDDGTTTFVVVRNPGDGPTLSYAAEGGFELLEEEIDGQTFAFKDMNGNGELDTWEDWREEADVRAAALVEELTIEQISGLMLYGAPAAEGRFEENHEENLRDSHLRSGVTRAGEDPSRTIPWVNAAQAFIETELASAEEPYVPLSISSDPRSGAQENSGYVTSATDITPWPATLGLAALFDADRIEEFAQITAEEYRALGISAALHPQVDLATEPRWVRAQATLGEDAEDAAAYAEAMRRGFEESFDDGSLDGIGGDIVGTFVKHVPGDGAGEGGRESHYDAGKYAVFPGDNLDGHASVFAAANEALGMMTNYSIVVDGDGEPVLGGPAVGTAYSPQLMDYIREEIGFEGAIVTDWSVSRGRAYGFEDTLEEDEDGRVQSSPELYFELLKTSVDLFGGDSDPSMPEGAYEIWTDAYEAGEVDIDADTRWRESAERILMFHFVPGLFENPYVDLEVAEGIVASEDRVEVGFQAQLDSVVMAKNEGAIDQTEEADWSDATVYIPHSYDEGQARDGQDPPYEEYPTIDIEAAEEIFGTVLTDEVEYDDDDQVTSIAAPDISGADIVLVGMRSPNNGHPFTNAGQDPETEEYYPLSLQWRPYTADGPDVREVSISGDVGEDGERENRSYFGATSRVTNEAELDAFERAVEAIEASGEEIPLVVAVKANNPVVPTEFEEDADAVLIGFGVSDEALIRVALGLHEPQGRLPITFPASMDAVEAQLEDLADTEAYVDSASNEWGYGFGLSWNGVID